MCGVNTEHVLATMNQWLVSTWALMPHHPDSITTKFSTARVSNLKYQVQVYTKTQEVKTQHLDVQRPWANLAASSLNTEEQSSTPQKRGSDPRQQQVSTMPQVLRLLLGLDPTSIPTIL